MNKLEKVPKDLEEAAEDFVWEVMENDEEGISELSKKLRPTSKISDFYDALGEFFKAGAEWMASQMPIPEDTVIFQKGVEEGKRLAKEDWASGPINGSILQQSEVDLDREVVEWTGKYVEDCNRNYDTIWLVIKTARHFYELGKNAK